MNRSEEDSPYREDDEGEEKSGPLTEGLKSIVTDIF